MMRARILPLLFLFVFQVTAGCTKEPERAKTQYPGYATDNATAESDNTSIPTDNSAAAIDGSNIAKDVVAEVNREKVTLAEYEAYLDLFVLKEQRTKDRLRKALLGLINNRLLAREAGKERMDRDAAIRGRIALAVSRVWENRYWNEVVKPTVKITDEKILEKSPPFTDSAHLFQIIVSSPSKAESLRRKLIEKKDSFENIARNESEGFSAAKGGDSGYVSRMESSMYDNTALDAIFRLKPGEISPVIQTPIGYAIFKVTEIKTASRQRMEWLEHYRPRALEEKAREIWEEHVRELQKKHRIVLNEINIQKLIDAMEKKEDLGKFKGMVLVEVDGNKWAAEELIDPSGAGVVHGPGTFRRMIESRVKEYLVNAEMERRELKKKFPGLMQKERLLREDTLAREMVQRSVREIRVTDKDIDEYYRENKGKFLSPRMVNVSVIEVGSRDMVEKVYKELAAGKSFGETATKYSTNKALKEGNLGWVQERSVAPQFASVRKLKVGEFNREAVELKNPETKDISYAIMRVNDVRPEGILPLAKINRRSVEMAVAAGKRENVLEKLLERVRAGNQVSIEPNAEDLINKFVNRSRRGGDHGKKSH